MVPAISLGADPAAKDVAFFEKKIRPVLVNHCYECHSSESDEVGGNLLLDSREGILAGGQSGPALVVGDAQGSLLVQALKYEHIEMPPAEPLPPQIANDFASWVAAGAIDPRIAKQPAAKPDSVAETKLWSMMPRQDPPVPSVVQADWPLDPLDAFILSRIEAAKLQPTSDAPPAVLVRRLYHDLIGLPPTLEQIQSFAADSQTNRQLAIEKLVDSLLDLPQFGERWGQHWLDVARFGESNGDDGLGRNPTFPHAWRYRDYVVDALNRDTPYDQFLTEQIAGDLLPAETADQRHRQLIATGFLAIGSKPAVAMNANFAMDVVDDQINVVGSGIMGLSIACARCHDHKHDPIPTSDYYALAGIFTSTESLYGRAGDEKLTAPPTDLHPLRSAAGGTDDPVPPAATPAAFPEDYSQVIDRLDPDLHVVGNEPPKTLQFDSKVKFSPEAWIELKETQLRGKVSAAANDYSVSFWFKNHIGNKVRPITAYLFSRGPWGNKAVPGDHIGIGGKYNLARAGKLFVFSGNGDKKSVVGTTVIAPNTWNHVALVRNEASVKLYLNGQLEIDDSLPSTFGDSLEYNFANRTDNFTPLDGQLAELALFERALTEEQALQLHTASGQPKGVATLGWAMGVRDKAKPVDCAIRIGGESNKKGPVVPRGVLTVYDQIFTDKTADASFHFESPGEGSGRRELAKWLTDPRHPQTARVMVNRIWMHLFGHGIVQTPNDFGVYGAKPSHPELLDHLAERFVAENWSIKRLIRALVLSRTYQLDSSSPSSQIALDPNNQWFARHSRKRLDAESLRDGILAVCENLDHRPASGSAIEKVVALINWPPGNATNHHFPSAHRSLYLCRLRHAPPPELAAFDLPTGVEVVGQREETTLPTQDLFLLNNRLVVEQSQRFAERSLQDQTASPDQQVETFFRRILLREPSPVEREQSVQYVQETIEMLTVPGHSESSAEQQAWAGLAQALFASNEFRFVD